MGAAGANVFLLGMAGYPVCAKPSLQAEAPKKTQSYEDKIGRLKEMLALVEQIQSLEDSEAKNAMYKKTSSLIHSQG